MIEPFFQSFQQSFQLESMRVAFEEILPGPSTTQRIRQRAVYAGLIQNLPRFLKQEVREAVVGRLRPHHEKAWDGRLEAGDFQELLDAFLGFKASFRKNLEAVDAYAMINCCAALLAQMLFVDNCLKEGLGDLSHRDNLDTVIRLAHHIRAAYQAEQVPIQESEARLYATYFVVQTLFDKIFVGDEEIVSYDLATGQVRLTSHYDYYTSYLELANSKLVTATDVEKQLCYQLTTGWGDGIDLKTWNTLNQDYYRRSEDNFFSAAYDEHLDRMIPQFPYGRARAASDIAGTWDGVRPVNFIEIGAGSGAFAVDLFMALRNQGKDLNRLTYRGLEPSQAMKALYANNFLERTGQAPPDEWRIETAGLEEFLDDYDRYLSNNAGNVMVFSYSVHHCYRPSLERLVEDVVIQNQVEAIYVLDGTAEHGWTKVYYMPLDCRSPEDFRNVSLAGNWHSRTLWHEPFKPLRHHSVSRAWCALRRLTPP